MNDVHSYGHFASSFSFQILYFGSCSREYLVVEPLIRLTMDDEVPTPDGEHRKKYLLGRHAF